MKLNKVEEIELTTEEVRALDIIRRLGEYIAGCAEEAENRAKGEAIYQACASLEFVHHANAEDPEDVIFRRKDLWHANEGDWSIEDLKAHLPSECADLIDRTISDACDKAEEDGYHDGYDVGYDEGYNDRTEEEEDE